MITAGATDFANLKKHGRPKLNGKKAVRVFCTIRLHRPAPRSGTLGQDRPPACLARRGRQILRLHSCLSFLLFSPSDPPADENALRKQMPSGSETDRLSYSAARRHNPPPRFPFPFSSSTTAHTANRLSLLPPSDTILASTETLLGFHSPCRVGPTSGWAGGGDSTSWQLIFGRIQRKQFKHQLFHLLIDVVWIREKPLGVVLIVKMVTETEQVFKSFGNLCHAISI